MIIQIPMLAIPARTFSILLNNQGCEFNLYQRDIGLYLDATVDDELIGEGLICLDRTNVIQYRKDKFKGGLFFIDTQGSAAPNYADLGARFFMYYASEDETIFALI